MSGLNEFYGSCKFAKGGKPVKAEQKGPVASARHKKKLAQARSKSAIREQVRELDGFTCRYPDCTVPPETDWGALEVAHFEAEGMGGNPTLSRYTPENLITTCKFHHRGPHSLHDGLRMEPLQPEGMRGSVAWFSRRKDESGKWDLVGVTTPPRQV